MIKVTRLNAVTSWSRALNAARRTVGKSALKKEPSDSWKASASSLQGHEAHLPHQ